MVTRTASGRAATSSIPVEICGDATRVLQIHLLSNQQAIGLAFGHQTGNAQRPRRARVRAIWHQRQRSSKSTGVKRGRKAMPPGNRSQTR